MTLMFNTVERHSGSSPVRRRVISGTCCAARGRWLNANWRLRPFFLLRPLALLPRHQMGKFETIQEINWRNFSSPYNCSQKRATVVSPQKGESPSPQFLRVYNKTRRFDKRCSKQVNACEEIRTADKKTELQLDVEFAHVNLTAFNYNAFVVVVPIRFPRITGRGIDLGRSPPRGRNP